MDIFGEVSILLLVTTLVSVIMRLLRQPLIVGYILAGILSGPYFLNVISNGESLELLSKMGVVFLLFIVGLYLNPKAIKEVGRVSLVTGVGQVVFTSAVGFFIAANLGIENVAAMYVAIALTFSSTIIILKLLADKNDLQKLYAKIAVGFLLVQDIIASLILVGVTVFAGETGSGVGWTMTTVLFKGLSLLMIIYLVSHYVVRNIMDFLAYSQELLFVFALTWGIGMATVFYKFGFSMEIGALVAGVGLSQTKYVAEISARLRPLRDFFIVIFFVLLGSQMILSNLGAILLPAIALSLFVLIGNPVIVIILMNVLGYQQKTGFLAGLTVAQISEFSLILAALGVRVGHLNQETLSLITLVGLITISVSTYMILYSDKCFALVAKWLKYLELIKANKDDAGVVEENYDHVIFGYDRVGDDFVKSLKNIGGEILVVDFNPDSIKRLDENKLAYSFGDASDVEFLEELPLRKPKIAISTIPDIETNKLIIRQMRGKNSQVKIITIANTKTEAGELYDEGAAYVILPHQLGAKQAVKIIKKCGLRLSAYKTVRKKELKKI